MTDQEVVSSCALSQPIDNKLICHADSCAYARESAEVQPQITGMLIDKLSCNENDLSKNVNHVVSNELDVGLHACSLLGTSVISENASEDYCSDASDAALNVQSSYGAAPFGYPPCLRQIVQSALSVLDFGGVPDNVLRNCVTVEHSDVNRSDVSESAICNRKNNTKVLGGDCTDSDEKQTHLADTSKLKSTAKNIQDDNCPGMKRSKDNHTVASGLSVGSLKNKLNGSSEITELGVANKAVFLPSVKNSTSCNSDMKKSYVNGDLEKTKFDVAATESCESTKIRSGSSGTANGEATCQLSKLSSVVSTSIVPGKDISEQQVTNDNDSVDDAEWKSVEVRRRKKDVVCKNRESVTIDKSVSSASRAPVCAAPEGQVLRSTTTSNRLSLTVKAKLRSEEMSAATNSNLSLDSLSFPELPLSSCKSTAIGILPQVFESINDSSDLESAKRQSSSSGQLACTVADTSSYASIVIGAKCKSVSTNVPITCSSITASASVLPCGDEQDVDRPNGVAVSSACALKVRCGDDLVSSEVSSACLHLSTEPLSASDCDAICHSKKSSSMAAANCDIVQLREPSSALLLPCHNYSGCIISFGDVQLFSDDAIDRSLVQSSTSKPATNTVCSGASIVQDSGSNALHVISVCDNSVNESKTSSSPKPAGLFFDTRLKSAATSIKCSPFDIVFGFDSSLPVPDCGNELNVVAETCARLSFDCTDSHVNSRSCETQLHHGSRLLVGDRSMLNVFDLPSAQAYFNAAFNDVMADRESHPNVVFYYGVDIK